MKKDNGVVHSHKGYTLIEMMIAMFIFGIIALIVVGTLRNVFTVREAVAHKTQALTQLQRAAIIMTRDFEGAIRRPIRTSVGRIEYTFFADKASNGRVVFTRSGFRNPDFAAKRSQLQRVGYEWKGDTLSRLYWAHLDPKTALQPKRSPLLSGVTGVHWAFYDRELQSHEIWPPTGTAANDIPKLIELTLTLKDKGDLSIWFLTATHSHQQATRNESDQ